MKYRCHVLLKETPSRALTSKKSVPEQVNILTPLSAAMDLASKVFPVPGDPARSTPPIRATPRCLRGPNTGK